MEYAGSLVEPPASAPRDQLKLTVHNDVSRSQEACETRTQDLASDIKVLIDVHYLDNCDVDDFRFPYRRYFIIMHAGFLN